jgi:Ala-tRNA(Pro) deacylase
MPSKTIKEFLNRNHVKYVSIGHSPAFTAQEIAASAHIPGKEVAKAVIVKMDGKLAMSVLPASHQVDLERLRSFAGATTVELAHEKDFAAMFPGCELGAMPPFGSLYGMATFVAKSLTEDEEIAFNAGTHTELIRLPFREYMRLEEPKVLDFSLKAA